mmetsp:Transcript_29526/g.94100  ORF Transcript_29526/g.94100 Transcript_29526/m.94100 type:complete len:252 (+) Transcript_29526:600-1355(+)
MVDAGAAPGVLQLAALDDEHAAGALAEVEDDVAHGVRAHGQRGVADLAHDVRALAHVVREEGVQAQRRGVHLVVQLDPQGLGDQLHQPHRLLGHGPLLRVHHVRRVALGAQGQAAGDAVLVEVAPQKAQLLGLLAPHDVELRHVRGQDAEEDRAGPERHDVDKDGKQVLLEADGGDLVHAPGELRECPAQRHDVLHVEVLRRGVAEVLDPVQALGPGLAHGVPEAGHKVAHAQHRDDELQDVAEDDEDVRG